MSLPKFAWTNSCSCDASKVSLCFVCYLLVWLAGSVSVCLSVSMFRITSVGEEAMDHLASRLLFLGGRFAAELGLVKT